MAKEPARPSSGRSPDEVPPDRLDSWKDIAVYLQRDVSTVQRWEKREGMPVHRHVHEKLGTVYAFRSEVDAWWRGRGLRLAQQEGHELNSKPVSAAQETRQDPDAQVLELERRTGPRQMFRAHRQLILLGTIAAALVVTIAFVRPIGRTAEGTSVARPGKSGVVNPEAQDLLLRSRYLNVRTTDADSQRAIALLERAIELDPAFATAYAELASAYVTRLAYVTPDETRDLEQKAFSAAEKAVSLDPNLPEAYLARGDLLWTPSHRFAHERAVQEFRRALSLNPKSDQTHRRLARVYVHVGFFEEALQHADIALAINPSNGQALNSRAQALLWMGKDEEALAILLSIPGPVLPELVEANTAFALHRLGRPQEAWSYLRQAVRKYPNDPSGNLRGIEAMLLAESESRKAQDLIESIRQRDTANPSHHAAYFAACALARMRRAEQAVQWLREAATTGFPCYSLFARDPNLDPIRQDPRFQAFMAEMQKTSASLRRALFPDSK
jgi:tetratricopeptide (TPR) repeat protein